MNQSPPPVIFLFDFETTDLRSSVHEPIQVAALLVSAELEEIDAFESLIRPLTPHTASEQAMETHKKPIRELLKAPHPLEVFSKLKEFAARAGKPYVSGFNVGFDLDFLKVAEERLGLTIDRIAEPILDARAIYLTAKGLGQFTEGTKLSNLCEKYGIATDGAHDALADVRMTLQLLRALRKEHPEAFDFLPQTEAPAPVPEASRACRVCGCVETRACVTEGVGIPCHWVGPDLCSACEEKPDEAPELAIAGELAEPPLAVKVDLLLERILEVQTLSQKAATEVWDTEPGKRLKLLEETERELRDELKELLKSDEDLGVLDTPNGKAGYQTSRIVTIDHNSIHRLAPKLYEDVVTVRHDVDKTKLERLCKVHEKNKTLPDGTLETILAEAKVETRRSWICKPQPRKEPGLIAQDPLPEVVAASGARPDGCPF